MTWQVRGNLAILSDLSVSRKTLTIDNRKVGSRTEEVSVSRQKHTCVMMGMGPVTVDRVLTGQPGARGVPERDREFWSQCPINEPLPEWFNVLDPAEDSTGR
jgi:hypothetical protein